jgi:cytochrome c biogenesis protein
MSNLSRLPRQGWRRLTSMRTAIVLLFLLALASVPGSLLPQRPLNPAKVQSYLQTHGAWGRFLDAIGGFDVFGSVWFSAVYLLLFLSLIGCIVPRIRVYARALRSQPLKAPRHLSRLAENGRLDSAMSAEQAAQRAKAMLRPRWRTVTRVEDSGAVTVSAEKGYSREAGNLLFHVSLLVALVLIAAGRLFSYQGSVVVVEGTGFCNPGLYDSFHAGRSVDESKVAKFCIDNLNSFNATYLADGTPSQFRADVTYSEGANGAPKHDLITVNHPLRMLGDRIYLINHGFAPTVTIKRPGKAPWTDTEAFLPQDGFLTSEGVFKLVGPAGESKDIGLQGLFAPTPQDKGNGVITSISPQAKNPVLALFAFTGDTGVNNGVAQSVYTLDTTKMTKVGAKNLAVGQSMSLPDGTTVTFDGYKQWASLQVSHDPTQTFLLIAAVSMVTGLLGSLVVRRRRIWLRISEVVPGPDSGDDAPARSLVEVGGLARNDSGNFTGEFESLLADLRTALDVPAPAQSPARAVGAGIGKD